MDLELGELLLNDRQPDWPVQQPAYYTSDPLFCWPWCSCVPFAGILLYFSVLAGTVIFSVLGLALGILCCLPVSCFLSYTWFWKCCPLYWGTDLYQKMIYLAFWTQHRNVLPPEADEEHLPVEGVLPKKKLEKYWVDYALNIKVPRGVEEQFLDQYMNPSSRENFVEQHLAYLPMTDRWDEEAFAPEENPVDFVMTQLNAVYPPIYQEWTDKHSDDALTRMALYGLGAKRVECEVRQGRKLFVVRTNMLSGLPVRPGFERYGGDAYFDELWRPVMIVDKGLGGAEDQRKLPEVISQPGDEGWDRAKFRFRSSLFTLVTIVDHLYGIHLQTANLFVTALREQMSPDHPIRRFLTPFTYQTIAVNDNAAHNLTAPRSMGPRCFALTDKGMAMAYSAAPTLVRNGQEVKKEEGGPILNISDYVAYLKRKGVDTEFWRQSAELCGIYEQFLREYLELYYPSFEDLVHDKELAAFAEQFFHQLEGINPESLTERKAPYMDVLEAKHLEGAKARDAYDFYVKWLATLMWTVTAAHEQDGAVEVYAQDVSWTAFKWKQGCTIGNKQTATAQALLMSFTSTPMPKLLGTDWTHLFPDTSSGKEPHECFDNFQENLQAMAEKCEDYNAASQSRPFPHCFPLYTVNPNVLEVSVSV